MEVVVVEPSPRAGGGKANPSSLGREDAFAASRRAIVLQVYKVWWCGVEDVVCDVDVGF